MDVRPLAVDGALVVTPTQHRDARGVFAEWFAEPAFREAVGHPLRLAQANCSVSAAGVVRGIHVAEVPPGQAKYVFCPVGAVLDVVVDLRVGSPTFGAWDSVLLDDVDRRAVYLAEGLGHAFMSLADGSTVVYLCSEGYAPGREHAVHPLDPEIGVAWPHEDRAGRPLHPLLSDKDAAAPGLAEALRRGLLPTAERSAAHVEALRGR